MALEIVWRRDNGISLRMAERQDDYIIWHKTGHPYARIKMAPPWHFGVQVMAIGDQSPRAVFQSIGEGGLYAPESNRQPEWPPVALYPGR